MIFAEDLTKKFDDFLAVDGVSLNVSAGQVLVLLGPNGAGKTTTIRMLTSILIPTRGRAVVAGFDVIHQPEKVRASVGVLTEQHGLYGRMNAVEYLEFFGQLYSIPQPHLRKRVHDLLEQFGLEGAIKKRLGEYSKGMRQKLALVRALLHSPPVLLLDEPTSAMDPESAHTVRDAIHTLRSRDRAIILCTHNLYEAEELADQVALIRQGRIILLDTLSGMKAALLGPPEYEARVNPDVDGWNNALPPGVELTAHAPGCLRFQVSFPQTTNPLLLRLLLDSGLDVVSFHEIPRSLEKVYLAAVMRQNTIQ